MKHTEASKHTIVLFGTLNTAVLLTSSLTMVLAVRAIQENDVKCARIGSLNAFWVKGVLYIDGKLKHEDHPKPLRQILETFRGFTMASVSVNVRRGGVTNRGTGSLRSVSSK